MAVNEKRDNPKYKADRYFGYLNAAGGLAGLAGIIGVVGLALQEPKVCDSYTDLLEKDEPFSEYQPEQRERANNKLLEEYFDRCLGD